MLTYLLLALSAQPQPAAFGHENATLGMSLSDFRSYKPDTRCSTRTRGGFSCSDPWRFGSGPSFSYDFTNEGTLYRISAGSGVSFATWWGQLRLKWGAPAFEAPRVAVWKKEGSTIVLHKGPAGESVEYRLEPLASTTERAEEASGTRGERPSPLNAVRRRPN